MERTEVVDPEISVQSTGIVMTEEKLLRLFKALSRAYASTRIGMVLSCPRGTVIGGQINHCPPQETKKATSMSDNPSHLNNLLSSNRLQKQPELQNPGILNSRSYLFLLAILCGWLLISYLAVSWFTNKRLTADLQRYSTELNQSTAAVTYHFERSLAFLNVMPTTIADDMAVVNALHTFDRQSLLKRNTPEDKRSYLNSRQDLTALNLHLATQTKDLDVDVIWILADNGDCIASSNYNQPESFIGVNYADRAYFTSAMAGVRGRQYAVGRKTNIPGLFFSAPIYKGGNIIGVVALKIDIARLSQWFNRFNCFVTDAAGVIILASDKALEHQALADAPVFRMSSAARDNQYKRGDFPLLKISNFGDQFSAYPAITMPGTDSRYMLARSQQSKDGYTIFTYSKVSEVEQLRIVQLQFTILIFVSGASLILLVTGIRCYLRDMRDAVAAAKAANSAKSEFLATMSHEIRTPMNGVIGMTGLLLETELTSEQQEYAEMIRKSGDNLLNLINNILDFSKIEARKLDMEMQDFDLRVAVEDTADSLAVKAGDAGLELICRIDPDVPSHLKGDPGRLRQIITNLTGNAIKFTQEGEVVISASLESDQGGIVEILFKICDTGIGIPKTRLAAIFEPFTQVDGTTTRKYGGTGLGLAICKQLAELMGGKIGVESEEGKGSTFWFTARFEKQAAEVSSYPGIGVKTSEVLERADITGERILVVDDNETNRKLMETLLNSWGCRYESASGAEAALKLLHEASEQNDPFRVALLDQLMPDMDGNELGRRIKSDPLLESTLMVMVTSLGRRGDAAILEQIGFAGYLTKPVHQSHLYDCIALVLGRAAGNITETGIVTRHTVAKVAHHGVRILLAEDNVINQKVAQRTLSKLGFKADVVASGLEAVRALELINYDLVLMDCQMPEMDGFEATAVIRNPESKVLNHKVAVIAMTANAMKGDREQCIKAGMDDYLPKPVKKDELTGILEKWLK
jgi:signal transduction histidine kinase/DNA-binding response OmpR family regulator